MPDETIIMAIPIANSFIFLFMLFHFNRIILQSLRLLNPLFY